MNTPRHSMPRGIRDFFETYRDAFNALDGLAVADLYAEPCGIAQDGRYTHWQGRADVAANMVALCDLYRAKGFVGAGFEPRHFIDQGPSLAIADVQWRIDWDSGADAWHFGTTYNLIRTPAGWRILLCTAYSESALHQGPDAR